MFWLIYNREETAMRDPLSFRILKLLKMSYFPYFQVLGINVNSKPKGTIINLIFKVD